MDCRTLTSQNPQTDASTLRSCAAGCARGRSSLPDDECVAFPEGLQAGSEPWSVVLFSRGHITLEVPLWTPARPQGLAKRESIAGLRYMIELLRFPAWT